MKALRVGNRLCNTVWRPVASEDVLDEGIDRAGTGIELLLDALFDDCLDLSLDVRPNAAAAAFVPRIGLFEVVAVCEKLFEQVVEAVSGGSARRYDWWLPAVV